MVVGDRPRAGFLLYGKSNKHSDEQQRALGDRMQDPVLIHKVEHLQIGIFSIRYNLVKEV